MGTPSPTCLPVCLSIMFLSICLDWVLTTGHNFDGDSISYLSSCLPVYLSLMFLSICLDWVLKTGHNFDGDSLSYLSSCLPVYMSTCLPVYLSTWLPVYNVLVYLSRLGAEDGPQLWRGLPLLPGHDGAEQRGGEKETTENINRFYLVNKQLNYFKSAGMML